MFESNTAETILERMLERVDNKFDKREGGIIWDSLSPASLEIANLYVAMDMLLDEMFGNSASYYYLIERAAERGLFPQEATASVCKMTVIPIDAYISAGNRFNLNNLNYSVIGPIDGETGSYQIQCETVGTDGNQQTGQLLPIEYIEGLETATLTEILIPGEDEEEEEVFRERYYSSFSNKSFGGNKTDYKEKINAIAGVGGCKVLRAWNGGYSPLKMIPSEAVETWFNQQSAETIGEDVYSWMQTIYNAASNKLLTTGGTVKVIILNSEYRAPSNTLIQLVQETLDPSPTGDGNGIAPIGHVVNVQGATETTINFDFSIIYDSGYSFESVQSSIESAIDGKLLELRQSWANSDALVVRVSVIESLLINIPGIVDVTETLINGLNSNLILDANSIPIRGTVNG